MSRLREKQANQPPFRFELLQQAKEDEEDARVEARRERDREEKARSGDDEPPHEPGERVGASVRGGSLPPLESDDDESVSVGLLPFPIPPRDVWWSQLFHLGYSGGGYGLGWGLQDVMALDAGDRDALCERLNDRYQADQDAMNRR